MQEDYSYTRFLFKPLEGLIVLLTIIGSLDLMSIFLLGKVDVHLDYVSLIKIYILYLPENVFFLRIKWGYVL